MGFQRPTSSRMTPGAFGRSCQPRSGPRRSEYRLTVDIVNLRETLLWLTPSVGVPVDITPNLKVRVAGSEIVAWAGVLKAT